MPHQEPPYVSKVIPSVGEFKVIVDKVNDPRALAGDIHKVLYYTLSLGGNKDKCVNITIPTDTNEKALKLSWAETTNECSLDTMKIKGNSTQIMLQLAITIAREISPHVTHILLNDMSHFQCNTPEGQIKTHLPSYYIALYGKTWYEDKFGAVIHNPEIHEKYRACIPNLLNPKYKPEYFDFVNKDLIQMLTPIYNKSICWQDFFNRLSETYGDTKCGKMYPWLMNALLLCFEGSLLYLGAEWRIDINPKNTPKIRYHEYKIVHGGSKNYKIPTINPYIEMDVNYNQVVRWKYRKNKTRKVSKKRRS